MILNLKMLISNLIIHQIAQTIVVTCLRYWLAILQDSTLKIKETDRLEALRIELTKWEQIFL
jgi:hypothetical protein